MLIAIWLAVAPLLMMTETSWLAAASAAKAPKAPATPKTSSAAPRPPAPNLLERWTEVTVDTPGLRVLADPTYDRADDPATNEDWDALTSGRARSASSITGTPGRHPREATTGGMAAPDPTAHLRLRARARHRGSPSAEGSPARGGERRARTRTFEHE